MNEQSKIAATQSDSQSVIKGTSVVALWTLISRVFGFVRDLLVARLFGAGYIADCFYVAFRIPNLLRAFVAEGALSSAFVPVFTGELKRGPQFAQRTIGSVISFLLILTSTMTIVAIVLAPQIVHLLAPGYGIDTEATRLCIKLTRIMLPYIIFISYVAMLNAALNSIKIFGTAALAQAIMNLVLIAGALLAALFDSNTAVVILSVSVVAGGLVQVIFQIPALKRGGYAFRPAAAIFTPEVKQIMLLMLPAIMGATIYQISQFLSTLLASFLKTGSVTWLFYADRLTQLPIGIFSIALASVLLPTLANARANDDHRGFGAGIINSLRYTSFFILPISFCIFYFAEPLISLMFEHGKFTHNSTMMTALSVQALAIGIWGMSCHTMVVRGFIARKDTVTPTLIGFLTLGVSFTISIGVMGPLDDHSQTLIVRMLTAAQNAIQPLFLNVRLYHAGLALSSSLAAFFAFLLAASILHRRIELDWGLFVSATWKSLAACIMAVLAIDLANSEMALSGRSQLILILPAALVFLGCSYLLRSNELRESWQTFVGILYRRTKKNS